MRSLYHRIAATRTHFWIQNWMSRRSFRRWQAKQREQPLPPSDSHTYQPKVTFLLDARDTSNKEIKRTLDSIYSIQGNAWEIILIAPEVSSSRDVIKELGFSKNIIFADQHTSIHAEITGDYVIFCQVGDRFSPRLLERFYPVLQREPHPDVVSYDNSVEKEAHEGEKPFFKPSQLSPALLLSLNYLSRSFICVAALRDVLPEVDPKVNLLAQEYNALLRLCEQNATFSHLPFLLVTQSQWVTPVCQSNQEVIRNHLTSKGFTDVTFTIENERTQVNWKMNQPSVSIVILTKDHAELLRSLITSIFSYNYTIDLNIKIIDNSSSDKNAIPYYEELKQNPLITIIPYKKPFNYSEAINLGARESNSDLILFLNDDMRVINSDWLSELAQWAMRPDIGVVGAKLIRENRSIQHAGIIMGLSGFTGHIYLNAPEHYFGLWGSVDWYRDILALTGACQMVRRDVFNQVGGYDENYRLAFGDIDFCLRVHEAGYRNIYNPNALLFHYEGMSRGYDTPVEDTLFGYNQFENYLLNTDPFYSPNLTCTRIPHCIPNPETEEDRFRQIEERKKFYTKSR